MEGSVYKFFRFRATEAWHQLSTDEQGKLIAKEAEIRTKLGVKNVAWCNTGWNNERWESFGVHEYPNMDAVLKHYDAMVEMGMFRYLDAETMLGTSSES